jgi:hypothetical protein
MLAWWFRGKNRTPSLPLSSSSPPLLLSGGGAAAREERERSEACVHATSRRQRRRRRQTDRQTTRTPLHIITGMMSAQDDVDVPAIVAVVVFDDDTHRYHQRETDVARNGMVRGVGVGIIQ